MDKNKKRLTALLVSLATVAVLAVVLAARRGVVEERYYVAPDTTAGVEIESPAPAPPSAEPPPPAASAAPSVLPSPTPRPIQETFVSLREHYGNADVSAFLSIPGTNIDYPVMWLPNDTENEFYLTHGVNKEESKSGALFMDYENDPYLNDLNTVVYGHNMKAGTMFHNLRYFADKSYMKSHRYVVFDTVYENGVYEVFSFMRLMADDFYYIQVIFDDYAEFWDFASEVKRRSMYDTGVSLTEGDVILLLSTCTSAKPDERYVLAARRLSAAEIPDELR